MGNDTNATGDDWTAEVRRIRPEPPDPTVEVTAAARRDLAAAIAAEQTRPARLARPARRTVRLLAAAAAVAVVAGGVTTAGVLVGRDDPGTTSATALIPTSGDGPTALRAAAVVSLRSDVPAPGGRVRHIRFQNFTDPGAPVYDQYIQPDGRAEVGPVDGPLTATEGFVPTARVTALPTDPTALRDALLALGEERGLGQPGDSAERVLYRVATDLLPDPALSSATRSSLYRVLAATRTADVAAQVLPTARVLGRDGVALRFTFAEGAVDTWVLDRRTGALLSTETVLPDGTRLGGQRYLVSELTDPATPSAPA